MRFNVAALYIMLPCSMVLLAATAVSVKSQTPSLQGTYALDAAASDNVDTAIGAAVKDISGAFTRSAVRRGLGKINVAYKQISISYTKVDVTIGVDQYEPLRTPVDGTPVDWTREDGEKVKVSTVWESGNLKRTFKVEAGQRINTYIISADGKKLTMQVSVNSTYLPQPLTYKLVYQRSN